MLKVYLQRGFDDTGKGKFLRRLAKASLDIGVEYTENPKGCDALLDLAWWHGPNKKMPRVLRIDGASDKNRERILDHAKKADAVIWQSQYCKSYFKLKVRREYVIYNGADPKDYGNITDTSSPYNVLMSGNWMKSGRPRPEKKLAFMLQVAIQCLKKCPDICFWVAGDVGTENLPQHKNIKYLGWQRDEDLAWYIANCDMMLNLAEGDWCPNAVVECLVAGHPVMYSVRGGGILELVKDSGWSVAELDHQKIVDKICEKRTMTVYRPDLHIENVAKQYKQVFEDVLNAYTR